MSFLSWVYLSKACSIVEVSVLASTTRKFFCASGGWVTCYKPDVRVSSRNLTFGDPGIGTRTPMPASRRPVTES